MHTQYAPPSLDQAWLLASLKDAFPSHKTHRDSLHLLEELVVAYTNWWWLMLTYPNRRIVGTPPLWFVKKVHASRLEDFFYDCSRYLGKVITKDDLWQGELDFRGTHDTARSLHEKFNYVPLAWEPVLRVAQRQKSETIVRVY